MIQRIGASSQSFRAKEITSSVRDAYNNKINSNTKIAQEQNKIVSQNALNTNNNQIAMQGNNTQKLDVIA